MNRDAPTGEGERRQPCVGDVVGSGAAAAVLMTLGLEIGERVVCALEVDR